MPGRNSRFILYAAEIIGLLLSASTFAANNGKPPTATQPAAKNEPPTMDQIAAFGLRQLRIQPAGVPLHIGDADAVQRAIPDIRAAAPVIRVRAEASYEGNRWRPSEICGTSPAYFELHGVRDGRKFDDADVRNQKKVCLVGTTLVLNLLKNDAPMGKEILVGGVPLKVIGILKLEGSDATGRDLDDLIVIPWTTAWPRLTATTRDSERPTPQLDEILLPIDHPKDFPIVTRDVIRCLRDRHHLRTDQPEDFKIDFPLPPRDATKPTPPK